MTTLNTLNPLDWLIGLMLAYSIVRAAMRGFFREAFALGGLIVGFALACWYYHRLAVRLQGLITTPSFAEMAAFLLLLFGVMMLATLIGALLRRSAKAVGLGVVDRLFGALFGLARGLLLGVALLLAAAVFLPGSAWLKTSLFAPYFLRADHALSFVMPDNLQHRLTATLDDLKHKSQGWIKSAPSSDTGF